MRFLQYRCYGKNDSGVDEYLVEIAGTSKDSKPTAGIVGGSKFIETDTGKTFVFDEFSTPQAWTEMVTATAEVTA